MKSLETVLNESLAKMSREQMGQFFTERNLQRRQLGKAVPVEVQLSIATRILKPIKESGPHMTESQERQVKAWMAMGHSRLEAEVMAKVHDRGLQHAAVRGETAGQFFESLKESHSAGATDNRQRQQEAYKKMGLSMPEFFTEGRR